MLSPHYDQTAIGENFIQGNIILEIFLQDLSIIFGNLYVNTKIHGHVLKKFWLTSEEFRQLWRSLRGRVFKTSDKAQLTVICLIIISNTQFCLVKCRETTNFEVFVAQPHKLQFIADSRTDEEVYCCNCFRGIDKLIYCIS